MIHKFFGLIWSSVEVFKTKKIRFFTIFLKHKISLVNGRIKYVIRPYIYINNILGPLCLPVKLNENLQNWCQIVVP